jgi:hypothetical protein
MSVLVWRRGMAAGNTCRFYSTEGLWAGREAHRQETQVVAMGFDAAVTDSIIIIIIIIIIITIISFST